MAGIFFQLSDGENCSLSVLGLGSYLPDYPSIPSTLSLFDILSMRKTTCAFFIDIDADSATTGDSWNTMISTELASLYGRPDVTVLAVFGRLGADVILDDFLSFVSPSNALCAMNGEWSSSFGSILVSSMDSPSPIVGNTPFCMLFSRQGTPGAYKYRICDKFHMASLDTGDRDGRPAGSAASKDLLALTIGGATPTFPALAPYLIRRVNDLNATVSPVATVTAPAALDIGGSVTVGFDRKLIGPGVGANFKIGYSGGSPAAPGSAEFAYGTGASQLAIDGYLTAGERVVFTPDAASLASHAGGTVDLYAAENTAAPGQAAITDTMGIPYASSVPGKPYLLGSVTIGSPKLYLRNYPEDDGRHLSTSYESPDIGIYHQNNVEKPDTAIQAELRDELFRAVSAKLYASTVPNVINRIVLRVPNSGTMRSHTLSGSLFWVTPENLRHPAQWKQIGSGSETAHAFFVSSGIESVKASGETQAVGVSETINWTQSLPDLTLLNTAVYLIAVVGAENDRAFSGITGNAVPTQAEIVAYCTTEANMNAFLSNRCVGVKSVVYVDGKDMDEPQAPVKETLGGVAMGKDGYINAYEQANGFAIRSSLAGFGMRLGDTVQLRDTDMKRVIVEKVLTQADLDTGSVVFSVPAGYDFGVDGMKGLMTVAVYTGAATTLEGPDEQLILDTVAPSVVGTTIKIK